MQKYSIAIIGDGVIARILMLSLQCKFNAELSIFGLSNHFSGNASCGFAAAGMVAPVSEMFLNEEKIYTIGKDSILLWKDILSDACEEIFCLRDTIILAHSHNASELETVLRRTKLCDVNSVKIFKSSDIFLYGLEPNNNLARDAILIRGEGVVNVPLFFTRTSDIGSKLYCNSHIKDPRKLKNDFTFVFDVRGMGASIDSLFSVRGEAIEVYAPNVSIQHVVRFVHPRYQLYIVPRKNGVYYIGATSICVNDRSAISVQSTLDLLGMLCFINPLFSEARVLRSFTGCRPTLPSGLPYVSREDNVISMNGFSRHGYLFGPVFCNNVISSIGLV